jgi:hypothetical protein
MGSGCSLRHKKGYVSRNPRACLFKDVLILLVIRNLSKSVSCITNLDDNVMQGFRVGHIELFVLRKTSADMVGSQTANMSYTEDGIDPGNPAI